MKTKNKRKTREHRKTRIRSKIYGTKDVPRLSVHRSNKNIFAQLIDDTSGNTLVAYSTLKFEGSKNKEEQSFKVGQELAKEASKKGIKKAVFDRSGYKYHGRVKKVAEGAREGGLKF